MALTLEELEQNFIHPDNWGKMPKKVILQMFIKVVRTSIGIGRTTETGWYLVERNGPERKILWMENREALPPEYKYMGGGALPGTTATPSGKALPADIVQHALPIAPAGSKPVRSTTGEVPVPEGVEDMVRNLQLR